MELYQLRTFRVVTEEQNITQAAKRLYSTPSAVSMQIKALEEELGLTLFMRTNRGVFITEAGQQILDRAIVALRAAQDVIDHATSLQQTLVGKVSIGLCSDAPFLKIPGLIQQMQADYSHVELRLQKSTSAQIIEAVAVEQLDMGFVFGVVEHPGLVSHHLMQAELVVALPASWRSTFDLSDWRCLAAQPWVSVGRSCPFQKIVDEQLFLRDLKYQHHVQIDDDRSRYDLVKAGIGLSLLEQHIAAQGLSDGTLIVASVEPLYCDLSLVYRVHERHQPLLRYTAELIEGLYSITSEG